MSELITNKWQKIQKHLEEMAVKCRKARLPFAQATVKESPLEGEFYVVVEPNAYHMQPTEQGCIDHRRVQRNFIEQAIKEKLERDRNLRCNTVL